MTHDTRVADWLGHSGASVKTGRFGCEIHSLSLEAAVIICNLQRITGMYNLDTSVHVGRMVIKCVPLSQSVCPNH